MTATVRTFDHRGDVGVVYVAVCTECPRVHWWQHEWCSANWPTRTAAQLAARRHNLTAHGTSGDDQGRAA